MVDELPARRPSKFTFVRELLREGAVLLHVDARNRGVRVPAHLRAEQRLVLRFGHGLVPAIVDMRCGEQAMSGTLSFGGVPFHCVLPWSAVYAAVSERSRRMMIWPEDVRRVVLAHASTQLTRPSKAGEGARRPHLKLVE